MRSFSANTEYQRFAYGQAHKLSCTGARGFGTNAANLAMKSNGSKMICVVPSL
ncbi:MAG: hypothetical protein ACJA11_002718 [Glaciecola sp.]|jgi:hypothetical protein